MPVIDRRTGQTGLPDEVIRALVPMSVTVTQPTKNPVLTYLGKVDVSKRTNPTGSTNRVVTGLHAQLYRPGGLLYRP